MATPDHTADAAPNSTTTSDATHFRQERDRARAFIEREKGLGGVIRNALEAAKKQFREQPQGGRGMLALTFANVLSSDARRQAFEAAQGVTKQQFMAELRARQDARIEAIKKERAALLDEHSRRVAASKAALIERQNHDREKMREAWRQFYASKESIAAGPSYRTRKPRPLPSKDALVKDQFEKARLAEANNPPREVPHDERRLSTPAPEPRPAGIIDPPHSEAQRIPLVDRQEAQEPPSRRASIDWSALHEKAAQAVEPSQLSSATAGRVDWSARAQQLREQHGAAAEPEQPKQRPDGPRMKP
jgi:hypothetical protein